MSVLFLVPSLFMCVCVSTLYDLSSVGRLLRNISYRVVILPISPSCSDMCQTAFISSLVSEKHFAGYKIVRILYLVSVFISQLYHVSFNFLLEEILHRYFCFFEHNLFALSPFRILFFFF